MVAWIIVGVAGLFEIGWAAWFEKHGRLFPSRACVGLCLYASEHDVARRSHEADPGWHCIAVWTGIGASSEHWAGGAFWFDEPAHFAEGDLRFFGI